MAQGYLESMWIRFLANILVRASQHPVTSESHKGAAPKSIRFLADILARALQHHDSSETDWSPASPDWPERLIFVTRVSRVRDISAMAHKNL
jgi:hypothetical protein